MKDLKISDVILQVIAVMVICFFVSEPALAQKRIEKDLDEDGRVDQVLIYDDSGTILCVETDKNHDGYAERLQVYKDGRLVRIERDTDKARKINCIDYFENDKRVRQKRFGLDGNLVQISFFDEKEQIRLMKKDTTGTKEFDTHYYFINGILLSSTRDTDDNGRVNVWTAFENQLPKEQKQDENEDGIMERVLIFDSEGKLKKLFKDPFVKGKYKSIGFFEKGEIKIQHRDQNEDGKPDVITTFEKALPREQKKDTNFDGRFDVLTRFSNGLPKTRQKDMDFDGKPEYFAVFDESGQLAKTREDTKRTGKIDRIRYYRSGEPYRVELDNDGNGFFETVSLIENNKIIKNMIDKNQDGRFDVEVFFNENQEKKRLVSDSNFDGKKDVWQFYANNMLSKFEKDENGDTKPDLKVVYQKGKKIFLSKDMDFDGYFEITQKYDDPAWSMIISQDINADRIVDIRFFYKDTVLRRKEVDENFNGVPDIVEVFSKDGALEKIEEKKEGKTVITWFYDAEESLVRGEEDKNGDGIAEICYLYDKGNLKSVQEDTNQDGKPDLWEEYDETQAVVKRQKDLDFDGMPDFVDLIEKAEQDS